MQNDFLQRRILPKCFISDPSRISMEARAKEKFFARKGKIGQPLHSHKFIIPYSSEIFNRKNKIFFPKKKKSRKPF